VRIARAFAEATSEVEDAMLLVTFAGEVVAANRTALAEFGIGGPGTPGRLGDLLPDGADRLAEFLRRCSGSKEPTPTVLALRTRDGGDARDFRCDGALFRPEPEHPPLLKLRLRPREIASRSFALLARQVDELNREIDMRRRYAAELTEALQAQDLLLQELQHRVRNTIQLFVSLVNRESRRSGNGAADLRALAARFHAVGFVQKQVASAADLCRVEVGELVRDILGYLHPPIGSDPVFAVDVDHVELPVEVATPLALLLNECLTRVGSVTSPRGGRVEGRRGLSARLVLSVARPGAAEAFALLAGDRFVAMLAAQIDGSMVSTLDGDVPGIAFELPFPGAK
jgi:hypothetical protein